MKNRYFLKTSSLLFREVTFKFVGQERPFLRQWCFYYKTWLKSFGVKESESIFALSKFSKLSFFILWCADVVIPISTETKTNINTNTPIPYWYWCILSESSFYNYFPFYLFRFIAERDQTVRIFYIIKLKVNFYVV